AEGVPGARHLGRGAASRRNARSGHDHRGQHRSRGADFQRRALRCGGRPVRRGRPARAAVGLMLFAAEKTRPVLWHMSTGLEVLWYFLAVVSVLVFAYGVWRP